MVPVICFVGDWDGLDPNAELAKLRHMKVDDWRCQKRKEKEWRLAVAELQLQQKHEGPDSKHN